MPWSKDNLPPTVRGMKLTGAQVDAFVGAANAALLDGKGEGDAIAIGIHAAHGVDNDLQPKPAPDAASTKGGSDVADKDRSEELENARSKAQVFYCRHMQAGVAEYQDADGNPIRYLIDTDPMKRLLATGNGIDVYVYHQDVDYTKDADGYVAESFYNELDGWGWFKFLAVSEAAQKAIKDGWSVSNAYSPTEFGDGGTKNAVSYDRAILDGEFTHLAIVPNPRYEDAKIFTPEEFKAYQAEKKAALCELQNSKDNEKGTAKMKFKFWKRTEVKNADEADHALTEVEVDGETRLLSELIEAVEEAAKEVKEAADKVEEAAEDAVDLAAKVKVGEEEVEIGELINRYKAIKKNEADEAAKKAEADAEAKKERLELENAISKGSAGAASVVVTSYEKMSRGKSRYGSGK